MGLLSTLIGRRKQSEQTKEDISSPQGKLESDEHVKPTGQNQEQWARYSTSSDNCKPPCPVAYNEDERQQTIKALGLASLRPGQEVDAVLKTVATVFAAPISAIALFMTGQGNITNAYNSEPGLVSLPNAICFWSLIKPNPTVLVVEDLTKDKRFAQTCWVELGLRAYMSCSLLASNGHRIGSVCFFDVKPRKFEQAQVRMMANFAEVTSRLVESRAAWPNLLQEQQLVRDSFSLLRRSISSLQRCVLLVDAAKPGCAVLYANPAWQALTGMPCSSAAGSSLMDLFGSDSRRSLQASVQQMAGSAQAFRLADVELVADRTAASCGSLEAGEAGCGARRFALNFRPAATDAMDDDVMLCSIPCHVAAAGAAAGTAPAEETPAALQDLYFVTVTEVEDVYACNEVVEAAADSSLPLIKGLAVHQLLGAGSFATVYRGTWKGETVAVKISQPFASSREELQRAVFEVKLASEIKHPHIVRTLAYALLRHQRSPLDDVIIEDMPMDGRTTTVTPMFGGSSEESNAQLPADGLASLAIGQEALATGQGVAVTGQGTKQLMELGWDDVTEEYDVLSLGTGQSPSGGRSAPWDKGSAYMQLAQRISAVQQPGSGPLLLPRPGARSSSTSSSARSSLDMSSASLSSSSPRRALAASSTSSSLLVAPSAASVDSCSSSVAAARSRRSSAHAPGRISMTAVMEYCDKGCLQDAIDIGWLRENRDPAGPPSLPFILQTLCEVAAALEELHSRDVVHGDLTTFNVLLSGKGLAALAGGRGFVAKVADFGLAHSLSATAMLRINSYGTVTHMAPEVLLAGISSKAADVYSLGVLMWQLLTFQRPWQSMRHHAVIAAVAQERRVLEWPASVPADLAALGRRCMAWEACQRPDMAGVRQSLQHELAQHTKAHEFVEDW